MRLTLLVCSLSLISAVASADDAAMAPPPAPAAAAPAIDPSLIPQPCVAVATVPTDSTNPGTAVAAKIALATCAAEIKLNGLTVTPDDAGIAALTDATKFSFDLLAQAISSGDAAWTPVAQKAKSDLYVSLAVRIRNSVPPITLQTAQTSLAAHQALEPKIKAWLDMAMAH